MVWILITFFSLLSGIFIGAFIMYRRDQKLIHNHKTLYNELKDNKIKLNEYQKKLSDHFADNIELLNKIAENYRHLYQNMIKNANFFIPNTYHQDNMTNFHTKNIHIKNEEQLPIAVPKDYCENAQDFKKNNEI